jgi:predicted alpha/beta-fold hydrolase
MAGEYGASAPDFLERIVSVSAPIDLAASSRRLARFNNIVFDRYFASSVVKYVIEQHRRFPDTMPPIPNALLTGKKTLARVDDLYVAPSAGFTDGQDYYRKCSSAHMIGAIKPKTLILTAEDDPIADVTAYHNLRSPRHHQVIITKRGGHVAWVAHHKHPEHGRFWMDHMITNWVGPV